MSNNSNTNNENDRAAIRLLFLYENTVALYERIRRSNRQISELIDENERLRRDLERSENRQNNHEVDVEQIRLLRARIQELEAQMNAESTRTTILQGRNEDLEAEVRKKVTHTSLQFAHKTFQGISIKRPKDSLNHASTSKRRS